MGQHHLFTELLSMSLFPRNAHRALAGNKTAFLTASPQIAHNRAQHDADGISDLQDYPGNDRVEQSGKHTGRRAQQRNYHRAQDYHYKEWQPQQRAA